ncbi:FapA family protein, partial [Vibrio astriarenae]
KGSIRANYAQYYDLHAFKDIDLSVHSMNNTIHCGRNLTVLDARGAHGTLSGGEAKVGAKVLCSQLGVEGDTATKVEAFASYFGFKERIAHLKETYKQAQEGTMDVIRKELEFKKRPKLERSENELHQIEQAKVANNARLDEVRQKLEHTETEFELALEDCIV